MSWKTDKVIYNNYSLFFCKDDRGIYYKTYKSEVINHNCMTETHMIDDMDVERHYLKKFFNRKFQLHNENGPAKYHYSFSYMHEKEYWFNGFKLDCNNDEALKEAITSWFRD